MLDFIDFGAGNGTSFDFGASVAGSNGLAIDKSESAVAACATHGIAAEQGDVLDFDRRNAASGTFAINLLQELPGREAFARTLINVIRAARDYTIIQHPYFEQDSALGQTGSYVAQNFHKKITLKPMVADYIEFLSTRHAGLSLSGMAIFVTGRAEVSPLPLEGSWRKQPPSEPAVVAKTMRIVFGRKTVERFRPAVDKLQAGQQIFSWEMH